MLLQCNNYAFVFDYLFARALVCVVYTFKKITPPLQYKLAWKDFSRAWIGIVVTAIGEDVSHTGQNSYRWGRLYRTHHSELPFVHWSHVMQHRYIRFTRWLQCLCWPTHKLGRNTEVGVRSITKKEATRLILIMTICSIGYCKSPQITEMWC